MSPPPLTDCMGDLQVLLQKPNGGIIINQAPPFSYPYSSNPPHPLSVGFDYWLRAEQTIQDIISQIRPTLASEQRREEVTHYIQGLIGGFLGTKVHLDFFRRRLSAEIVKYSMGSYSTFSFVFEYHYTVIPLSCLTNHMYDVFPYGSVPLKTYLPDGDIDLTAISSLNVEDALAKHVHAALEREEQNKTAEFEVKDVQYINAEVKLVKCLVQNIVVDISFNQSGGLSTLCFLEHVDRLIGKNHLFKRSVILIKAWCYYESRILGAHHGLISTYALETLVLYIFHLFFTSLNGPLAVLYRFLDYFSKFDWDKYCVSLNGPICISSLSEIAAETLENDGGDLLLGKDFLRDCVDLFSVQLGEQEANSRAFLKKYLNIVDPLKENNNLGRSVSRGNFYRIRSAFAYGARKLEQILLLPPESIAGELHRFFLNTLDRHGNRQRPDLEDPIPPSVIYESSSASSKSRFEKHTEDEAVTGSLSAVYSRSTGGFYIESWEPFEQIHETRMPMTERKHDTGNANGPQRHANGLQRHAAEVGSSSKLMVAANGITISGFHLPGDAKESPMRKKDVRESPATSRIQVPNIGNETPRYTPLSNGVSTLPPGHHTPDFYFSHSLPDNGKVGNGRTDLKMPTTSIRLEKLFPNGLLHPESHFVLRQDGKENEFVTNNTVHSHINHKILTTGGSRDSLLRMCSTACGSKDLPLGYKEVKVNPGNPEAMSSLSDLSGDYESYLEYLNYAKWCNDAAYRESLLLTNPSSLSQFRNKHLLNIMGQKMRLKLNATTQMNANGVIRPSSPYPLKVPTVFGVSSGVEEVPKLRGMGTYFPSMNLHSYRDTPSAVRERNLSPVNHGSLQRPPRSNGGATIMHEAKVTENSNKELLEAENKLIAVTHGPMKRPPHNNGWSTVMQEEKLIEKSSQELLEAERNSIQVNNASLQRPPHSNGWATIVQEEKEIEKSSKELLAAERKQIAVNRGSIQVKKPIENSIQGLVESEKKPSAANHGPMQRPPHNNGWDTTAQEEKLIKKSSEELVEAERNQLTVSHGTMERPPHSNGWATAIQEEKPIDQFIQELLEAEFPLLPSRAPPRPVEFSPASRLSVSEIPNANGCFSFPPEKHECGLLPVVAPLPEVKGMQPEVSLPVQQPDGHSWEGSSSLSPPSLAMPSPTPVIVVDDERVPVQSYHLKDDSDFPPLSGLNACGRTCRRR